MPRPLAASITVAPAWTSVSIPSIVTLGMGSGRPALRRARRRRVSARLADHAAFVVDVVLELVAEVLDEALDRQRRRVAQRADRPAGDVVGDVREEIEILLPSLAVLDAVHHPVEPARALAAGRALP